MKHRLLTLALVSLLLALGFVGSLDTGILPQWTSFTLALVCAGVSGGCVHLIHRMEAGE